MKLCILGNSHIASLKAAWDNGLSAAHPNTEITFFGARRHLMLKLVEENGRLVAREDLVAQSLATTSGGATSIDPSDPTRPKGRYADYVALSNDLIFRDLSAELIAQPEATVVNGMGTDAGFSAGSTRLAVGKVNDDFEHREEENRHMNAEFGGIWLQAFLARL